VLRLLSSVASSIRSACAQLPRGAGLRPHCPALQSLSDAPIYIDDTPNISTMELRTKARRLQAEHGLTC